MIFTPGTRVRWRGRRGTIEPSRFERLVRFDDGEVKWIPPDQLEFQVRTRCMRCGFESDCYLREWNDMALTGNARHALGCDGRLKRISPAPAGGAVIEEEED